MKKIVHLGLLWGINCKVIVIMAIVIIIVVVIAVVVDNKNISLP